MSDTATLTGPPNRRYFLKELVQNPFPIAGKPVGWEVLGGDRGRAWFDPSNPEHVPIIKELALAASQQRGGIIEVSQENFEEAKKKSPYAPPRNVGSAVQPIPSRLDFLPQVDKAKKAPAAAGRSVALATSGIIPGIHAPGVPPPAAPPQFPLFPQEIPGGVLEGHPSLTNPERNLEQLLKNVPAPEGEPWRPPTDNPVVIEAPPTTGKMRGRPKGSTNKGGAVASPFAEAK